nr:hypothetical protein [Parachlamydiaceae bacterium]
LPNIPDRDNKLPNIPDRGNKLPNIPDRGNKLPNIPDRGNKLPYIPDRDNKLPNIPDRGKDKPWNDRDKDRDNHWKDRDKDWKDRDKDRDRHWNDRDNDNYRKHHAHRYHDIGKKVRYDYHHHYKNKGKWFNRNFWHHHHYHPPYYASYNNWWAFPTIGGLITWLGWKSQPYYYGYYNLGYTTDYWGPLEPDVIYSPSTYYQKSQAIEAASDQSQSTEWMSLGVFAVSKTSDTVASPNMFIQLVVNKEGVISGTFYIATSDQVYELEGFVDQQSQRAVWQIADIDNVPVIETGIYNLTEAEVPIRLYYPDGTVEDKLLIRLDDE